MAGSSSLHRSSVACVSLTGCVPTMSCTSAHPLRPRLKQLCKHQRSREAILLDWEGRPSLRRALPRACDEATVDKSTRKRNASTRIPLAYPAAPLAPDGPIGKGGEKITYTFLTLCSVPCAAMQDAGPFLCRGPCRQKVKYISFRCWIVDLLDFLLHKSHQSSPFQSCDALSLSIST